MAKSIYRQSEKRVVYAEADHSFVDILFSFMTLPVGTIVKMLGKLPDAKFEALGSLNNLYQSLKDFPKRYFATEECKFMLLNPRSLSYDHCKNLKLKIDDTEPVNHFFDGGLMNKTHSYNSNVRVVGGGGVFVSDVATFIFTDDFPMMPYSVTSLFGILTDLGINDTSHLEEKNLDLSSKQVALI
ncbi:hypothetical protein HanOQP8_Chr09g0307571 [Helianthus annuus]|nr:hypothetical protein HanLR1_Chr09g0300811 [Helianthus annuus]KAJ0710038.1 hypothetical protein HanOQP8_Chr09g0307571 [Helianthus annuus]KAJ0891389.1 hypothetical protein HanPSC8_Chr09g0353161 [Helianthus annuus]